MIESIDGVPDYLSLLPADSKRFAIALQTNGLETPAKFETKASTIHGDDITGEPYFAVDVGESYEVSDVRLRFADRDGSRYRIEMSGTISDLVLGYPVQFTLSAWADEQPDHSYGDGTSAT